MWESQGWGGSPTKGLHTIHQSEQLVQLNTLSRKCWKVLRSVQKHWLECHLKETCNSLLTNQNITSCNVCITSAALLSRAVIHCTEEFLLHFSPFQTWTREGRTEGNFFQCPELKDALRPGWKLQGWNGVLSLVSLFFYCFPLSIAHNFEWNVKIQLQQHESTMILSLITNCKHITNKNHHPDSISYQQNLATKRVINTELQKSEKNIMLIMCSYWTIKIRIRMTLRSKPPTQGTINQSLNWCTVGFSYQGSFQMHKRFYK